jgi:hypothetical protein
MYTVQLQLGLRREALARKARQGATNEISSAAARNTSIVAVVIYTLPGV